MSGAIKPRQPAGGGATQASDSSEVRKRAKLIGRGTALFPSIIAREMVVAVLEKVDHTADDGGELIPPPSFNTGVQLDRLPCHSNRTVGLHSRSFAILGAAEFESR